MLSKHNNVIELPRIKYVMLSQETYKIHVKIRLTNFSSLYYSVHRATMFVVYSRPIAICPCLASRHLLNLFYRDLHYKTSLCVTCLD